MNKNLNTAVSVLMHRDGNTREEAEQRINEVRELFDQCNYEPDQCEEILLNHLGLELDYIFDIIW